MEFLNLFHEGKEYTKDFYKLYESAFPISEKKTRAFLEELVRQNKMEMIVIVEAGMFIGLAINMIGENAAILDYFAISPEKRSGGWGSRAIQKMLERFAEKKYILEVEMRDLKASNAEERERRRNFYLRNGLKSTDVYVNIYQTDFELLTLDGNLTYKQYIKILTEILGQDIVRKLNPYEIK